VSEQVKLGDTIQYEGQPHRVIRIVMNDHSLFEDGAKCYIITESYLMLKALDGSITFIVLSTSRQEFTGTSDIRAMQPLSWRKPT
jgi:hypothetical protein